MGEKLDFTDRSYLRQIYDDQSKKIVYKKSAQVGLTERMITEAMWLPDQYAYNSLYFFPTAGTVSDLVQERIDDPINNSDYLKQVINKQQEESGEQSVNKVRMKKLSKAYIYFRGSQNPTQITSVPADAVFVDELDRMVRKNVPYFTKRLGNSDLKWERWASTPTIADYGIDKRFQDTDQHHYQVKCPNCETWQHIDFFENVEFKLKDETTCEWAKIICQDCEKELEKPYKLKGEWVAKKPDNDTRGYYISKLYTPNVDVEEMAINSQKTSQWEIEQFYNQDLGLAYEPEGGQITNEMLQSCVRGFEWGYHDGSLPHFMGIDVGKVLNVIIEDGDGRIVEAQEVDGFNDLDRLMSDYNVDVAVIDAMPETRKSQEFVSRFKNRSYMCWYNYNPTGDKWYDKSDTERKIRTHRTMSLDEVMGRFNKQKVKIPENYQARHKFGEQMKGLKRVVRETDSGAQKVQYVQTGDDHYFHACNYANLARETYANVAEPEVFVV